MFATRLAAPLLAGLIALAAAAPPARAAEDALPSWPAFAANAEAQARFDQGRRLAWLQDRDGAVAAFRAARTADPECALCWWGEAWALGTGIARPITPADNEAALDALAQARRLAPASAPRTVALVEALATRHSADPLASQPVLDRAYAGAMLDLMQRYRENEIAVLAAAALIALQDGSLMPEDDARIAHDVAAILEGVLGGQGRAERMDDEAMTRDAANPHHPGALQLMHNQAEAGHMAPRRTGL